MSRTKEGSHLPTPGALWEQMGGDAAFRRAYGGRKFTRTEKITLIFPDGFNEIFNRRSLSYRTWFLNRDAQGGVIREQLSRLLAEDAFAFFEEMLTKCRALLFPDDRPALGPSCFETMLASFSRTSPLFVQGGEYYREIELMIANAPERALATLMICATLGENYGDAVETVFALWQIDRSEALEKRTDVDHFVLGKVYYERKMYPEADREFLAEENQGRKKPETAGELYYYLGSMRFFGQGRRRNADAAEEYLQKSVGLGYGAAAYVLFLLYRSAGRMQKALEALAKGAELMDPHCIRDLAGAYYHGNEEMLLGKSLEKARELYRIGSRPDEPEEGDPQCQYMLARIYEMQPLPDKRTALFWYETAARNGSGEARRYLSGLTLKKAIHFRNDTAAGSGKTTLVLNSLSEPAACVLGSCKERDIDAAVLCGEPDGRFDGPPKLRRLGKRPAALLRDFGSREQSSGESLLFLLLSDDLGRNLYDALELIDEIHELIESGAEGGRIAGLTSRATVFLRGRAETCRPMIDSALGRLGEFYLPVYVCDDLQAASEDLLLRLPLFIPSIRRAREARTMRLVVMGSHPGVLWLIKNAIAAAQVDSIPFSVALLSRDAKKAERQLRSECPGIFGAERSVVRAIPEFYGTEDIKETVMELLRGSGEAPEAERRSLKRALRDADYIAVYEEEDEDNIHLAMWLREWYLKTDPEFQHLPFIAAHCGDDRLAWQTASLVVGDEPIGNKWFNSYRIECFGNCSQLYSLNGITGGFLEKTARRMHRQLYAIENEVDSYRADNEYFSRSYNRDSSRMLALALPYRLFAAGFFFPDWRRYQAGQTLSGLAEAFDKWLGSGTAKEQEQRLERLSIEEHSRWNRFMLTRGWMRARAEEVLAYTRRGCTSHQLHIAKLHPFICSWEELEGDGSGEEGVQAFYEYIVSQIAPEKKAASIRDIDGQCVRNTRSLLCDLPGQM